MTARYVELEGVTREFGSVSALEEVSLRIGGGEFHCLLGPNGSGKSTLMRLILGLTRPTEGTVDVPDIAVGCGFQRPNFYPDLTAAENIEVFGGLVGGSEEWNRTVVEELQLGPALDRRAGDLSGGYARKLDLALAVLKEPDLLLLDEPLGALDDVSATRLLGFLRRYVDQGNTVLVSTHRVTEFEGLLDRVTVLHRGELLLDERREEMALGAGESLQRYYVDRILELEGVNDPRRGDRSTGEGPEK